MIFDSARVAKKGILAQFNSDAYFLIRYHGYYLLAFLIINPFLYFTVYPLYNFHFSLWNLYLIPAAIFTGMLSSAGLHIAAHDSFQPRWFSRFLGELFGIHQLYGFLGWKIFHLIHHKFPDDPLKDPHPPLDQSFFEYALTMHWKMYKWMGENYLHVFGRRKDIIRLLKIRNFISLLAGTGRLVFWYLLLGPMGFIVFYLPSYLTSGIVYAHFNYFTHRPQKSGSVEILDLNDTLYYKFMNAFFWGSYYHKSHHIKPHLMDPRNLSRNDEFKSSIWGVK